MAPTKKSQPTTTITIKRSTMAEVKKRAVEKDMRFSDYLEELIRDAWDSDVKGQRGRTGKTN